MNSQWILVFPRAGSRRKWFYVKNLLQAGELIEYAEEHLETHDVIAKGFFGKKALIWVLDTEQKIRAFFFTMQEGLGFTKLKMEARKKQATL